MKSTVFATYKETYKFKMVLAIATGLFVFVFLLFFQPFGVNNYRPDERITLLIASSLFIFSSIATVSLLIMEFPISRWLFSRKRPKNYLVWIVMELVVTASATFMFYNTIGGFHDFYLVSYFRHIVEVGSLLIIPFTGTHFYFRYSKVVQAYKDIRAASGEGLKYDDIIMLTGAYKKDRIALPLKCVRYIQSEDNYASVNYLEDNMPKKYLLRATLTSLEKRIGSSAIIRVNRSHMINLIHLETFKNDSGKLKLKLANLSKTFEVSKGYRAKVVEHLEAYTN
ncbi:MAG: LytTR family DNA-binding domain-containing protein [Bacteroidota bacterium]